MRRAAYAWNRISSNLKDSTEQFGWLQARDRPLL
jgi:hypothetical protein